MKGVFGHRMDVFQGRAAVTPSLVWIRPCFESCVDVSDFDSIVRCFWYWRSGDMKELHMTFGGSQIDFKEQCSSNLGFGDTSGHVLKLLRYRWNCYLSQVSQGLD